MADNWHVSTDDYDIYNQGGDTVSERPGSPSVDDNGSFVFDPQYFPLSTINNSMMDQDPNNTGPTNDFWTYYPISIDINGYIFYNGENTGINIRGPAGASHLNFDDLTPAQKESLKGEPGSNGINGRDGTDGRNGQNGMDAYEMWLVDNGWADDPEHHPHSEFYAYLANLEDALIKVGAGTGSLILNYKGVYNIAPGIGALASGYGTAANGNFSFTTGNNTIAANPYQAALGIYNKTEINSLLEIGNGSAGNRSNALWLSFAGDLTTAGNIQDGNNNVLANKVDKVVGKGLSTNDFDNTYKDFIDGYTVDEVLNLASNNPIANSTVTAAINNVAAASGKPTQTNVTSQNGYFGLFHPSSTSDGILANARFTTNLLYNPLKHIFTTANNTIDDNSENCFLFGTDLTTDYSNQFIIGTQNLSVENDLFEIGNGSGVTYKNAFRVNKNGNAYAEGTFIDGQGNNLSQKQDLLSYDSVPTQDSDNLITSGDLYSYLVAHGFDPTGGIIIPQLDSLQAAVTALTARVSTLETTVAGLTNPREFIDDTYTYKTYLVGVDRDNFYIKLKETPTPEPEEEEEEGE